MSDDSREFDQSLEIEARVYTDKSGFVHVEISDIGGEVDLPLDVFQSIAKWVAEHEAAR